MGQLIYLVNHTLKEYTCPICKYGEFVGSPSIMEHFIDLLRERWNNCQIEIIFDLSERMKTIKKYKDIKWKEIESGYF